VVCVGAYCALWADAGLREALRRWNVRLFTEERALRERVQYVEKREAQAAWREVSLIRREEAVARQEEEVRRREDAVRMREDIVEERARGLEEDAFWGEVSVGECIHLLWNLWVGYLICVSIGYSSG